MITLEGSQLWVDLHLSMMVFDVKKESYESKVICVCVMWWEYDENMHTFFFRNYGNKGIKLCTKVLLSIWKMDKIYVK